MDGNAVDKAPAHMPNVQIGLRMGTASLNYGQRVYMRHNKKLARLRTMCKVSEHMGTAVGIRIVSLMR